MPLPAPIASIASLLQVGPDADGVDEAVPDGLTLGDWLLAGGLVVGAFVIAIILNKAIRRTVGRRSEASAQLSGRLVMIVIVSVGFVYALSSIGVDVGLFVGALGIGGIALAFAFQDILENFVAGIILQVKRPFVPGDIVQAGESRPLGTVKEVDSRSVIIDMFSGERIVLPAAEVLKNQIVNWTRNPKRRIQVDVGVHYRIDPQDAIDVIQPRLAELDELCDTPPPRVLLTELGESSVNLACFVWYRSHGDFFWVQHKVVQTAKAALDEAGFEIPFPQRVIGFAPDRGQALLDVRDGSDVARPEVAVSTGASGHATEHVDGG